MYPRRMLLAALVAVLFSVSAAAAQALAPPGVPDLRDPAVQGHFVAIDVSHLNGDPDFPLLVLARLDQGDPQFLALVIDARNGKETWSLREDAPVFYLLFADAKTIRGAFLDEGFAAHGKPSGQFIPGGPEAVKAMVAQLGEAHKRCRGLARAGTHI